MKQDPNCIYCKIVAGEAPCHKVFENESIISFLSIDPMADGHTLVVPKEHWLKVWKIEEENTYQNLMAVSKKIALGLNSTFSPTHILEVVEGIEVQHAHIHIIPAEVGYGELASKHETTEPDHKSLAQLAEKIKQNI